MRIRIVDGPPVMDEEKRGAESQTVVSWFETKERLTMTNALLQMFDGVAGASDTCLVRKELRSAALLAR